MRQYRDIIHIVQCRKQILTPNTAILEGALGFFSMFFFSFKYNKYKVNHWRPTPSG
jgi:hypothetical protein